MGYEDYLGDLLDDLNRQDALIVELVEALNGCERVLSAVSDGRSVYETPIYNARQALAKAKEAMK